MWRILAIAGVVVAAGAAPGGGRLEEMRMTPAEIRATATTPGASQVGSSGLPGVHTKVLFGTPDAAGFYTILLFVPPRTTIQAHSHRDDRVAVVVSGTWQLGYGDHFEAKALKTLPPGSVYSEPAGRHHFARTEAEPVIVEISGYGPTDTRYFDAAPR